MKEREALNLIAGVIRDVLIGGEGVKIVGFGKFYLLDLAARDWKNPRTGEVLRIPAKRSIRFKAGLTFKRELNGL